jgi:hypothetical protein
MQQRARLALTWGTLAALVVIAFLQGRAHRSPNQGDIRASTFLTGPDGARGLADALDRLHIRVERWRRRIREFTNQPTGSGHFAFVLIDPTKVLEPSEVEALAAWNGSDSGADLVLVGSATDLLMECFGWVTGRMTITDLPVAVPGQVPAEGAASSSVFLEPDSTVRTSEPDERVCEPVPVESVDTLLVGRDDRVAVLRLHRADRNRTVLLISDAGLLRNRTLKESDTGPVMLGLFAGYYDRLIFDEAVHGFGTSGSLPGAVLVWSRRSPWGWAVWQLAIVGLLALLAGAVRFGPIRPGIERRRRSPLEHVRALATALSAARGHDVAITALVRGLRRRLAPTSPPSSELQGWLRHLVDHAPTPRARDSAHTLLTLSAPGQSAGAVLQAANAVEDLWQEMHR